MELDKIIYLVNKVFDIDIRTKTRKRNFVQARAVYFYIARKHTSKSMDKIAKNINLHHSTLVHSLKYIDDWLMYEKDYNQKFNYINDLFNRYARFKNINTKKNLVYRLKEQKKIECYEGLKIAKQILKDHLNKIKLKQK